MLQNHSCWPGTLLNFLSFIAGRLFFSLKKKKKKYCQFFMLGLSCKAKIKKGKKKHSIFLFRSSFFNGIRCLKAFVQVSGVYRSKRFLDFSLLIEFLKMPETYSGSYLDSNNIALLSFHSCVVFSGKSNCPVASPLAFIHSTNIYSTPIVCQAF